MAEEYKAVPTMVVRGIQVRLFLKISIKINGLTILSIPIIFGFLFLR